MSLHFMRSPSTPNGSTVVPAFVEKASKVLGALVCVTFSGSLCASPSGAVISGLQVRGAAGANVELVDRRSTGKGLAATRFPRSVDTIAGTQGHLTIFPTSLQFGAVVGTTSDPQTVTLGNDGGASLDVLSLDTAVAPFERSGGTCASTPPFAIEAGASCTLSYVISPTEASSDLHQTVAIAASVPGGGSIELTGIAFFSADQSVTITDYADYVSIGATHDYVVVVSNAGPHTGSSMVTVIDYPKLIGGGSWTCVPTGGATCSSGSSDQFLTDSLVLPAGSSATYIYTVVIPSTDQTQIDMSATLTVLAPVGDPDFFNDVAFDIDAVVIFRDGFDDGATD